MEREKELPELILEDIFNNYYPTEILDNISVEEIIEYLEKGFGYKVIKG